MPDISPVSPNNPPSALESFGHPPGQRKTFQPTSILLIASLTVSLPGYSVPLPHATTAPGWKILPSLPDPVGFGGMFAGACGQELLAGGGSQFREKPIWLGGTKTFSDRIFSLRPDASRWVELPDRLPHPVANFACAGSDDIIYLVGGLTPEGSISRCWRIRRRERKLEIGTLPDLPQRLTQACAAVVGGRLYVVGGLRQPTDVAALTEVWSLPVAAEDQTGSWRGEPRLPGPGVFVASAASAGGRLYVLGGMEFDSPGKLVPSRAAYEFDLRDRNWRRLPDLPAPRVGPASPSATLRSNRLLVIGGYAEVFPGAMRDHPGFPAETFVFDIGRQRWADGPMLPRPPIVDRDQPSDLGPCPTVLGASAVWNGLFVVVSGESRASTRTPAVIGWPRALEP